jgi:hypothetical protein
MYYLYLILGTLLGITISFLFYKNKIKELSNLRLNYLMAQEEEFKFLKEKLLGLELSFHNFKKDVLQKLNKNLEDNIG